jgi:hypothetical protein
MSEH